MKHWICVTKHDFILARGVEIDNVVYMTFRADIGLVKQRLKSIEDVLLIAPTAYNIKYVSKPIQATSITEDNIED